MTAVDNELIQRVVAEVMGRMNGTAAPVAGSQVNPGQAQDGLFADVDTAIAAAKKSQQQLVKAGVDVRGEICDLFKRIATENAEAWGRFELDETKVGRLDHKIAKLELLQGVPGTEFLQTQAHSGDSGIALDEAAPWGVIGVITPVTHSIPTMTANAINMIAAGNTMVVNAHPSGAKSVALATQTYNRAIKEQFGIDPLICVINPPTLRTAEQIFQHPEIPMLVATGGPAVARAAMKQPKRSVVAGPGNPPVVVDETADLKRAAESIIVGAAFDNNLLCIGEKEVFVVEKIFGTFMNEMERSGAQRLSKEEVDRLTKAAFTWQKDHFVLNKDMIGKDPQVLGQLAGIDVKPDVELLFGETDEGNPFVAEEQMMPFVPIVMVKNFEEGLALAVKHEHGFGHTALIHSNNLANITRMGTVMNTTIFVVNGPCTAGLGADGEGYPSYSIATPTGEGITNPMTFTRFRRCGISQSLRMV
ncbi:aldehyde dehydrogenase family protein [Poriferisphaera sp. WC338]|uniref:aldehyde dehydrogenase family protein n=1 Tax=Poriferisphaera sp. WC338 TaxID=3425129 RepID=UPI003D813B07